MNSTKVIGLTGGIGSGKSSILQLFKAKGVITYIADIEAKNLMNNDLDVKSKIIEKFGKSSYQDNILNRTYLAEQVFADKIKLAQLNAIVHPAVRQHFSEFLEKNKVPFIIYENAILFENGFDKYCDYIITVTAPEATRIQRVVQRDSTSEGKVLQIISHQWSDEQKASKSDFVIVNIDWKETLQQFEDIYKKIVTLTSLEK